MNCCTEAKAMKSHFQKKQHCIVKNDGENSQPAGTGRDEICRGRWDGDPSHNSSLSNQDSFAPASKNDKLPVMMAFRSCEKWLALGAASCARFGGFEAIDHGNLRGAPQGHPTPLIRPY